MIHELHDGLGLRKILSNGAEVERGFLRCDTETGECLVHEVPLRAINGEAATETIVLENVTVEFLDS